MARPKKLTMRPAGDSEDDEPQRLPDEVVRTTHISRLPSGNFSSRSQAVSVPGLNCVNEAPPSQPESDVFNYQGQEYEPLPTLDSRELPEDRPWVDPEYEHFLDDALPFQPPRPKR